MVALAAAMVAAASGCGAAPADFKGARDVTPAQDPVPNTPAQGPAAKTPALSPPAAVYAPSAPPAPVSSPSRALIASLKRLKGRVAAPLAAPSVIPTPVPPPGKTAIGAQAKVLSRTSYQVCLGFVACPGQAFSPEGEEPLFCYSVQQWSTAKAAGDAVNASQPPTPDPRKTPAQPIALVGNKAQLYNLSSRVAVEMRIVGFAVEVEGSRQQALAEADLLAAIPPQAWPQGTGWLWTSSRGSVAMSWADGSLQWTVKSATLPAAGLVRLAGSFHPVSP